MRNKTQTGSRGISAASARRAALVLIAVAGALLGRYGIMGSQAHQTHQSHQARPPGRTAKNAARRGAPTASIQTHRNIGKAYYEQGMYPQAIAEFQKVIAAGHASGSPSSVLATDHLNLGMALMQANQLDQALGELTTARQMDPKLVAAEYNLGIVYKRELRYPDAEAALKRVTAADPSDPAAWFNLGTVYFAERKLPEALAAHQRVIKMGFGRGQNFYVASLFHVFTILIRLGKPAEAQKYLKQHQEFKDKVPGISVQNPALEAGKYGAILVPLAPPEVAPLQVPPVPVTFDEIDSKIGLPAARATAGELPRLRRSSGEHLDKVYDKLPEVFGGSVAVGDYDGDGHPDLYVVNPAGPNRLYRNNGDGKLMLVDTKAGVSGRPGGVYATFADYNNSGHPSLFVAGLGGITLYHNNGDGTFTDVTAKAGLAGKPGELATRVVPFDSDNDGFLDLLVTVYTDDLLTALANRDVDQFTFPGDLGDGKTFLYRNNGDGTFTDITASAGLASARGHMLGAVFSDFDNDGYADLLLFRHNQSPLLYINQGQNKFVDRTAAAGDALSQSRAFGGEVADFNHDGNFDLVLSTWSGYQVLLNRGDGHFEAVGPIRRTHAALVPGYRATVADVDGDGFDDLLLPHSGGLWYRLANRGGQFQEAPLTFKLENAGAKATDPRLVARALGGISFTPASLTGPGRLDLVGTVGHGEPIVFEKQGPPARWSEVKLDGYKSNKEGVGAVVEFKAGDFYKKVMATGGPVRVFVGNRTKLDVVRVTWPNLVVQNSINVATNQTITVRESERLASSCPFLYVWNGDEFRFLTDIMGVAPIGELAPDGTYIKPNPDQIVRLGSGLREQHGVMTLQVTSEMRETDYFDRLRLFAVDHPESEKIYANEIYSSTPPPLELYAVRDKRFPVSAVDDHGADVLPLLREADGRYPTSFRRNRILGLADTHSLTLDLGELPPSSPVALYLTGWVFWTDSNAARALMSNSRLQMILPYVQVRDAAGKWVTVIPDMGVPAGTNRTMRVDLTGKFLSADHHVRIVTNLCVYWDQIFFTTHDRALRLRTAGREMPLVSADLHYRGFSTPTSDAEHVKPDWFDYARLMPEAPWNPFLGRYTRYGAVEDLLSKSDDHLVVMATGDEMTARFSGRDLPPLKPGWNRDFFLYARGYAKDGEPNTADFRTAEPLPFYEMGNYPYDLKEYPGGQQQEQYLRNYETRPSRLLIPPLAPATLVRHDR
ncbi:MAG TPA: FG-GAP-like repeat-containing protein [Terriglobia bacterium]|nr:FG-GAP-like repeat-containing protein [Terriglobia bacterium]